MRDGGQVMEAVVHGFQYQNLVAGYAPCLRRQVAVLFALAA
jgi:hypothetical protein